MKILFVGPNQGTAYQRRKALERLGHETHAINPEHCLSKRKPWPKLHKETGGYFVKRRVTKWVLESMGDERYDLAWVDWCRYVDASLVGEIRRRCGRVVNYNNDDPLGSRDGIMWSLYRSTIPLYDLVVVMREQNVAEAEARGARKVLRVYMSADEVAHAPRVVEESERAQWESDVLFLGTWFPERGPFMAELIRQGVPLSIRGGQWKKAKEWPLLRSVWKGPGTASDDEYAWRIQGAKVCLGLLSKGNRDLHTQRTMEIPLLGGLLCAERTEEHERLYQDWDEAVFWSNAEECAEVCRRLLDDEPKRRAIARAGRERCLANATQNEKVLERVLAEAFCEV
ncbi:glycosyltransferase [Singulisphaera sp. Ch08]|uniref:Glycosyltransferase n=1 Tax=Singulisphaera sp. Ch08 TaxID=3120278 RepID=A0AAU7CLP6_9BACT